MPEEASEGLEATCGRADAYDHAEVSQAKSLILVVTRFHEALRDAGRAPSILVYPSVSYPVGARFDDHDGVSRGLLVRVYGADPNTG
jgi:hypothetical protein